MTNTELLEKKIKESGKKKAHLCRALGISKPTFRKLLAGQTEFKTSQVKILCTELGINTQKERESIFFA